MAANMQYSGKNILENNELWKNIFKSLLKTTQRKVIAGSSIAVILILIKYRARYAIPTIQMTPK